jgi:hypothetical protein
MPTRLQWWRDRVATGSYFANGRLATDFSTNWHRARTAVQYH